MPYSEFAFVALIGLWLIVASIGAWRGGSARVAFCASAVASIPAIAYSMTGYGLLPMGGAVHALSMGFYGLLLYWIVARCRHPKRVARDS